MSVTRKNMCLADILALNPGDFTFALIKPDGYSQHAQDILTLIWKAGLEPVSRFADVFDEREVRMLYYEHIGQFYYERNANFIMSGPSLRVLIIGSDAQRKWRNELMPQIRERWGQHDSDPDKKHLNLVHGSDSPVAALREVSLLFF